MSFGKNEAVPVRFVGVLRIDVEFFKVEIGENICCGKGSAGMTGFGTVNGCYNAFADLVRHFCEFKIFHEYFSSIGFELVD